MFPKGAVRALKLVLGTLLPVAGVVVVAFLLYGRAREAYLVERDHRALAAVGEQVSNRATALRIALATEHRSRLEWASASVDFVGPRQPCLPPFREMPAFACVPSAPVRMPAASDEGMRLALVPAADGADVYYSYDSQCDPLAASARSDDCAKTTDACVTKANPGEPLQTCSRIRFEDLIGGLLPDEELFHAVAVTMGTSPILVRTALHADVASDLGGALRAPPPVAERAVADEELKSAWGILEQRSAPEIRVREQRFLHFVQSVAMPAFGSSGDGAVPPELVRVHGLVRKAAFERERRRIPDRWVVMLLLIVALAALAWPLLKLWYMGPRERLNGLDVRILALSMVLGTGIVSLTVLALAGHRTLVRSFDTQAEQLAAQLEKRFTEDLNLAHAELRDRFRHETDPAKTPLAYHDFVQVVLVGEDTIPKRMWRPSRVHGVWRLEETDPLTLTVVKRQYYRDLRAGRLWKLGDFTAEVVRSMTTGDSTLVLAVEPLDRPGATALVTMRASRFLRAALPYGFGFAIVDRRGQVQLHSDERRVLVENLLEECDGDPRLRAALATPGHPAWMDVNYGGVGHRLLVEDVRGTPWRLVVFRDRQLAERLDEEVFASWAALYLVYLAAVLLVLLVLQVAHDAYRAEWIWPDRLYPGLYATFGLRLIATAVVAAGAVDRQGGLLRLVMIGAVTAGPVAALALALVAPRAPVGKHVLRTAERRLAHVVRAMAAVALVLLPLAAGDWPAALAFVALAALWRPGRVPRPSQLAALVAIGTYALLEWTGAPAWWRGAAVLLAAPLWLPWELATLLGLTRPRARLLGWLRRHNRLRPPLDRWEAWSPSNEDGFRFHYVTMLLGLLVVLGFVPALGFYRDAHNQMLAELVRFGRRHLNAAAERQADRQSENVVAREPAGLRVPRKSIATQAVYGVSSTCWNEDALLGRHVRPGVLLTPAVFRWLPALGSPIPQLRALAHGHAEAFPILDDACAELAAAGFTAEVPSLPWSWWIVMAAMWSAAVVMGFGVLWSIARLVFLLDLDRWGGGKPRPEPPHGTLNVWTFAAGTGLAIPVERSPYVTFVDLRLPVSAAELRQLATTVSSAPEQGVVEIDHPESVLDDPELHAALLFLLESLVHRHDKTVVLTSEVDPVHWASARRAEASLDRDAAVPGSVEATAATTAETAASGLLARWSQLLDAFDRRSWRIPAEAMSPEVERAIAEVLARKYPTLRPTDEASDHHADEPRYWQIWRQCSRAEKLTLRQLAEEQFLNPNSTAVVRALFGRLLVRRDPAFSLLSPSFRRFVLRAETPETILGWEQEGTPSGWARLRAPLMVLAALAVAYFLVAEPDAFNWSIALATGVAAGLPAILRLFSVVGDQRGGAAGR